jgi:PTH1 family peptidyl-tRNA hydrolase
VGLGNPGLKYKLTRHNAGFLVIDQIIKNHPIALDKKEFHCFYGKGLIGYQAVLLAKPQTFMNLSGEAVVSLVNFYKIRPEQMLIISDDMDLPLGAIRLKLGGGSGGHKGLASIIDLLGTNQIPRLRIGIGKPQDTAVIDFVLTPFTENEQPLFQSVVKAGAEAAVSFVAEGPEFTMSHFNGEVGKLATSLPKKSGNPE